MMMSQVLEIVSPFNSEILVFPPSPNLLPLPQLLSACREHLARFRRSAESDPQFCLELFRRAMDAGDPEAWHGLVDLFQPLLYAGLCQRGIAPDLAEEAVQQAFVALWLKSDSGAVSTCDQTLAQVLNYLWGSVRFALIKLRRQQQDVLLSAERDPYRLLTLSDSQAVEQALDARTLLVRVRKQVTAQEWQILWLRFGQELPPREIATLLHIPVAEIHTTLASAKRRLRNDPQLRRFMDADRQV